MEITVKLSYNKIFLCFVNLKETRIISHSGKCQEDNTPQLTAFWWLRLKLNKVDWNLFMFTRGETWDASSSNVSTMLHTSPYCLVTRREYCNVLNLWHSWVEKKVKDEVTLLCISWGYHHLFFVENHVSNKRSCFNNFHKSKKNGYHMANRSLWTTRAESSYCVTVELRKENLL